MSQGLKISELPAIDKNNLESGDLLVIAEKVRQGVYATKRLDASYILKLKTEADNVGSDDNRVEIYKNSTTSKQGTTVLNFRGLKAGNDIALTQQDDNILIDAKVDGENTATEATNIVGVYAGKNTSNSNLKFKSISGENGLTARSDTANRIYIGIDSSTIGNNLISNLPSGFPIQTKQVVKTNVQTVNTDAFNWIDVDGLFLDITRNKNINKIRIQANISCSTNNGSSGIAFRIVRSGTPIGLGDSDGNRIVATSVSGSSNAYSIQPTTIDFIDNLTGISTNSAINYKIQTRVYSGLTGYINRSYYDHNTGDYIYRTISTMTLTEICS
jgi:hypothetical protein